jgi:hypothetical protein
VADELPADADLKIDVMPRSNQVSLPSAPAAETHRLLSADPIGACFSASVRNEVFLPANIL